MFTIEWIKKNGGYGTIERMVCAMTDLSEVEAHAKALFPTMRSNHPSRPPDGYRILDNSGAEVRIWIVPDSHD
jgi:hypothetical protein